MMWLANEISFHNFIAIVDMFCCCMLSEGRQRALRS